MKVADMHCDTISELFPARERGEQVSILENHLHMDLKRMQKGDYLLQNFAMFVHLGKQKIHFTMPCNWSICSIMNWNRILTALES